MSNPGVSGELTSMIKTESSNNSSKEVSTLTKVLGLCSVALSITVIALSITVARNSASTASGSNNDKGSAPSNGVGTSPAQGVQVFPTRKPVPGPNECDKKKVDLANIDCLVNQLDFDNDPDNTVPQYSEFALGTAEQAGANVTLGYVGGLDVTTVPIAGNYFEKGMCPVNVHWHLGTEHLSVGEYDENGKGPTDEGGHRKLAAGERKGHQCHHYNKENPIFTTEYNWQHCVGMHVGETYEVHWPHSNAGACGTLNQYQEPFYDGVFCRADISLSNEDAIAQKRFNLDMLRVGVQAQVFTIVNDESYYYPNLMRGMIVDGDMGTQVTTYTGSTTGTSRDNKKCSQYTGITWQVDRKCHLISASTFDKMCADMKSQRDDMSKDLYAHGSREVVADHLTANNQQRRLRKN